MRLARRNRQDRAVVLTPSSSVGLMDLNRIRHEINRLFEDPFEFLAPATGFFEGWTPAVDVFEDRDKYVVKAEIPGMTKEDIQVSLDGSMLSLSGERKKEEEKREGDTYRAERYFGRFQRSLTLPALVEASKIQ